ncbi:MAG: hypothetical protein ACTSRG_24525 [Candidatus Helarchaeota archaeon]
MASLVILPNDSRDKVYVLRAINEVASLKDIAKSAKNWFTLEMTLK